MTTIVSCAQAKLFEIGPNIYSVDVDEIEEAAKDPRVACNVPPTPFGDVDVAPL